MLKWHEYIDYRKPEGNSGEAGALWQLKLATSQHSPVAWLIFIDEVGLLNKPGYVALQSVKSYKGFCVEPFIQYPNSPIDENNLPTTSMGLTF